MARAFLKTCAIISQGYVKHYGLAKQQQGVKMSTHATASKQWVESDLERLPVERNVRLRGLEVTRLDTFIDAAFAFVLTLLVISFDEIPSNFDEMVLAIKRIPGFFASFCALMMFWLSHRRWSRRYGLESNRTVLLSLAVIFMVLVYVYPLRMIFEGMFSSISNGYFASNLQLQTNAEVRGMFLFYSIGSGVMINKDALGLNQDEIFATKLDITNWFIIAIFSLISITIALTVGDGLVALAGYVYFLMFAVLPLASRVQRARQK
jgi:uncharacterized membrane protein